MQKKEQGFTLIELMITIAILAIIATMAAPSFQSQLYDYQLRKEFNDLVLTMTEAKSNAKALNKSVHVYFREEKISDPKDSLYVHLDSENYTSNKIETDEIIFRNNGLVDPLSTKKCIDIQHNKSGKAKRIKLTQLGIQHISEGACTSEDEA